MASARTAFLAFRNAFRGHGALHQILDEPVYAHTPRFIIASSAEKRQSGQVRANLLPWIGDEASWFERIRNVSFHQSFQPWKRDCVWRKKGCHFQRSAFCVIQAGENGSEYGGQASLVVVAAQLDARPGGNGFESLKARTLSQRLVVRTFMHGEVGGYQFHGQGKAAQLSRDTLRGLALGFIRERPVLFQQRHRVDFGELTQGEPVRVGRRFETRGHQHVQGWSELCQVVSFLFGHQRGNSYVIEDQQDVAFFFQTAGEAG